MRDSNVWVNEGKYKANEESFQRLTVPGLLMALLFGVNVPPAVFIFCGNFT